MDRFQRRGPPRIPYDRVLEGRISKFMEIKCDPYLSVDDITDHLRQQFFEYGRRKRNALKQMVAQIFAELTANLPKEVNAEDQDNRRQKNGDVVEIDNNRANNSFSNLYSKNNKKENDDNKSSNEELLIDLGSDGSDNEDERQSKKQKLENKIDNGPSKMNGDSKIESDKASSEANVEVLLENENSDKTSSASTVEPVKKDLQDIEPNVKIIEEIPIRNIVNSNQISSNVKSNAVKVKETPKTPLKRPAIDPTQSLNKRKKREIIPTETNLSFKDIGGNEKVLKEVVKLSLHMKHIELYSTIGEPPPRGFLLHGPPGAGKTLLAHALAGELNVPFLKVAGPEIIGGISGQSEERIRDLFEQAVLLAPCIVFFDEVDAISPDRESASKDMERRIVAQLLTSLDSLEYDEGGKQVLVIGATNRPDSIDPALRRAGRFEREVCLGIPDRESRLEILKVLTKDRKLSPEISLELLAERTPGYVGADLKALMRESALSAISRVSLELRNKSDEQEVQLDSDTELKIKDPELKALLMWYNDDTEISEEHLSKVFVTKQDFDNALKVVQPSAKREGFATVPNVTWDNVGSLKDIRHQLQMSIMFPVKYPKLFGNSTPSGVLLCGPPGCGKTLLAKAVANEAGINFISVKGPELLNMYLGESERAVRQCFQRARNSQPCVIFFDEIDALCPKRSSLGDNNSTMRIVNQLLTEMDGFEGRGGVFLMAATNRPDIIDPAVMRPGRFDRILFVNLPNQHDRKEILLALTKQGMEPTMDEDVDFTRIAEDERCEGFSGADLEQLVKEAKEQTILEIVNSVENGTKDTEQVTITISYRHFDTALKRIKPSVSKADCKTYESLKQRYTTSEK
uniref:Nuclear valosin-containing protein-like n=1 Tax=Cacopsylla melanoneura TaxID=428564 RepID=A0A8D8PPU3_9HEMI